MESVDPALIAAGAALGGALIALAGALGVQFLSGRQRHKEHLARIGGQFLTHGAMYAEALYHSRKSGNYDEAHLPAHEVPHYKETMEASVELSILGSRRVAFQVQAVSGAMASLTMLTRPDMEREVWINAMVEFGAQRLELQHILRKDLGSGRLPDDDLGHDVPSAESPGSTHSPWS